MSGLPGRRGPIPGWLLLVAFYCVAMAVALGANPFRGETITPFDRLVAQRAWSFVAPDVDLRHGERSDILNSRIPQWESAKRQIRQGEFPLWNDRVAGGGSFLTVNANIFTPAFAAFAAVPDSAHGFHLATWLNLVIAALGMHLLLRRYFVTAAAVTGALTFALCGFIAAWLYWPHVFTLIWAPWLLWGIDRCAASPGMARSLGIALPTALVALGGFPFLSVLVLEAGGLYALVLWFAHRERRWRFTGWYAGGSLLGLLLAALPLLGLVFWLDQFDLGYREGRGSYLGLSHWKQLLPPWSYEVLRVEQTMYVGLGMLLLAVGAVVLVLRRRRQVPPLAVLGLVGTIATAALVFELWPMWLVGWLPGMSFNSWSRAIGLLDLSLVLLGAYAIDACWKFASQRRDLLLRNGLLVLCVVQVVEIGAFFRHFNGPIPSDFYFPEVPSIEYLRRNAGPFDYVVADSAFGTSGTLGAYGVREWLGHYFRSPELQQALHRMARDPFLSHVASPSKFGAGGIRYRSPALAEYNVRYVAIDSRGKPGDLPSGKPKRAKGAVHAPLPAMPAHRYRQGIHVPRGTRLSAISVRLATYHAKGLPGQVRLRVLDEHGKAVASVDNAAPRVRDNRFVKFTLDKPLRGGRRYAFELWYEPGQADPLPMTAWAFPVRASKSQLRVDGKAHPAVLEYRLGLKPGSNRRLPFRKVFSAKGTSIYENTNSPRGPYFVAGLEQVPVRASGEDVSLASYTPSLFSLRYAGTAPGFVVVPMSVNDDWTVSVDGRPAAVSLKNGVMPAVRVDGPALLEFRYWPRALRYLPHWLAALLLLLGAMAFADRRWRTGNGGTSGSKA